MYALRTYFWNWTGILWSALMFLNSCPFFEPLFFSPGVLDQIISVNVKKKSILWHLFLRSRSYTSNCQLLQQMFLVASYVLEHCHSVNNTRARLSNHVGCCILKSDALLVLLSYPSAEARAQGMGPRGWHSASFISAHDSL